MEDQPVRGVGRSRLEGRRQCPLADRIGPERLFVGVAHQPLVFAHLRRDIVACTVKRDDPGEIGIGQARSLQVLRIGAHERDQMRPGAVPHQHHPLPVDPQRVGLLQQCGQRRGDIGRLLLDRRLRHQPVVDRSEMIAQRVEVRRLVGAGRVALVAALPSAAVDEQDQRSGLGAGRRRVEVEPLERIAAIGDLLLRGDAGGHIAARPGVAVCALHRLDPRPERRTAALAQLAIALLQAGADLAAITPAQLDDLAAALPRQALLLRLRQPSEEQAARRQRTHDAKSRSDDCHVAHTPVLSLPQRGRRQNPSRRQCCGLLPCPRAVLSLGPRGLSA